MSPYETLPFPSKGTNTDTLPVSLEDYGITSNGFLPEEPPLERLPHPYYAPWESVVESLATSLAEHTLRHRVDHLPILSTEHLSTKPEWQRACVVLGFLAHAYIWGGETAAEILPPSITLPLLTVSSHLGIPPVATYACVNLWNFRTTATTLTHLDALQAQHTFTGTQDESWFYMVSVAMEAQGAYIIPVMLHALSQAAAKPSQKQHLITVANALNELTACITKLGVLLARMDEKCNPHVFYHRIRPFLAGSKNMAAAGLPRGVFYDQTGSGAGAGAGEWRQLRGGSNGQSSLIQFLDVVLGVEHAAQGNSNPDAVGELLAVGEEEEKEGGGLSEEQVAVREAFQTATRALAEFRNMHLQMVARYIIIPSRQANGTRGMNLATASSRLNGSSSTEKGQAAPASPGELTGTGGTALLPFLKQSRDETFQAGQLKVR
ncbi:Indoleamine 2,3-dioxygenase [Chaetomidium leptoderma]|uniref:Indoleamine 2,3-dioxygenase n=1 Tax=Chaetomidium leptoderma TaxID=669021 RepID=A0AAN6VNL5_9PEZI|nr:Indoleamine 2,3-dioxygenase [Chaetomidium leptoderma]